MTWPTATETLSQNYWQNLDFTSILCQFSIWVQAKEMRASAVLDCRTGLMWAALSFNLLGYWCCCIFNFKDLFSGPIGPFNQLSASWSFLYYRFMVTSVQITQLSGNVLIVAVFSHTQRALCAVMEPRPQESDASQLTSHRHVGLELCLRTHCCSWTFFQSAYSIFPFQPDKSNHRWQPVMAFVKSHKSESITQDAWSSIGYISHVEDGQLNGIWYNTWAENHLARLLTHKSSSIF